MLCKVSINNFIAIFFFILYIKYDYFPYILSKGVCTMIPQYEYMHPGLSAGYPGGQLAPQGIFGGLLGSVAGGAIGNAFGHGNLGKTIGGLAGGLLPFQAGPGMVAQAPQYAPQLTPQGWFGNLVSGLAPVIGGAVGGNAGQAISGIGSTVGNLLPFQAHPGMIAQAPQYAPQLAPQGWFGNIVSGLAPVIGGA
ncbi:MAG: hypothetical protein OER56_17625, partial [Hyphomicrobiales bacterium]|nr:hypothetical protein [Hyphomicrobiales bacterium]